jgi:pyruvate formate lyase activating enzyme
MKEALYYKQLEDERIKCLLCPQGCVIREGKAGVCLVRKNSDGILYSLIYAEVASIANDPIEKKPLYHFYPGSYILSFGTYGCNLSCGFCQNWQLSQNVAPTRTISPQAAVKLARQHNSLGIAYTYNEPFIWYEYVLDTAKLAHAEGLKNVLVTNGEVNREPLLEILPYIDAMNIDLKSIKDSFYRKECSGKLSPVLDTIQIAHEQCHVEVTNLIIPELNDTQEEIVQLIDWLADISPEIPLHFSRYFPHHRFNQSPTPTDTLFKARELAQQKLKFVYLGNLGGGEFNHTYCPGCGKRVIKREGYSVPHNLVKNGRCSLCDEPIPIVES